MKKGIHIMNPKK